MHWTPSDDPDLFEFVRALVALRRESPAFRRDTFFRGAQLPGTSRKDLTWLRPDGREMEEADWFDSGGASSGCFSATRAPATDGSSRCS